MDFIGYLREWEQYVDALPDADVSCSEKKRMLLPEETLYGLRMTGSSAMMIQVYNITSVFL